MTSKLTREKAQWLHDACEEAAVAGIKLTMNPNELLMFTSYALAAMDSEPVAVPDHLTYIREPTLENILSDTEENSPMSNAARILAREVKFWRSAPLYRHAQPAPASEPVFFVEVEGDDWINAGRIEGKKRPDLGLLPDGINYLYAGPQTAPERNQVRSEHAEWSQATFGNVGPVGPLKHLSKEALEAAAEPGDLSEWADMQFLLWDAQRRAGITDEQITQAMIEKLAVNKQREWPAPKDGEPRLHIKAQPAPVVTFYRDGIEAAAKWIDQQREAYDSEHGWSDPGTGSFEFGNDAQRDYSSTLEELAEGIRALHPNAGNSPVIPDGYVMVPKEPTEEMLAAAKEWTGLTSTAEAVYIKMLAAAPQEVKSE